MHIQKKTQGMLPAQRKYLMAYWPTNLINTAANRMHLMHIDPLI